MSPYRARDPQIKLCDGLSRREWLRIGGASCLGLSLSTLLRAASSGSPAAMDTSFGRAKSCVIIYLVGGPPQHETFDPKPDAPIEIRGEFRSIRTSVPGLHFSELLPGTARVADKMSVIRSMTTDINSHSTSGYWMLTGYKHPSSGESEPPNLNDWPSIAATVGALKPSERCPFSSIVLPEPIVNNPAIPWPGQNGGMMGAAWNPHLLRCDPSLTPFEVDGLKLASGVSELRLESRQRLLQQFDAHFLRTSKSDQVAAFDRSQEQAFDIVRSGSTRAAFELDREPPPSRDRYGRHKFGQSLVLARRLVEAGVRLVQVNWPREPGDTTSGNPVWDTHQKNADRLKSVLCPQFDQAFPAFLNDLHDRGLLDSTLVAVIGEFGRSPRINAQGGRDHWGHCFSVVLAGAGTGGGRIIGASDKIGGYPSHRPIRPPDLAATLFHLLGIDPHREFLDPLGRPRLVTDDGNPIQELLT